MLKILLFTPYFLVCAYAFYQLYRLHKTNKSL
ncbi:Uncharacterised protein [Streptococcus suis]|uniref:Uncharacterized protein n=1 Tax=Streptococcus suis TaxID=1307 RepID=A0A0Z8NDB1_STRSU|nr:Uncharacterised protein [Streptococcus suis]